MKNEVSTKNVNKFLIEFTQDIESFVDYINSTIQKYHFKNDEQYDRVIDDISSNYDFCHIITDVEHGHVTGYSSSIPRHHSISASSKDFEYEACITSVFRDDPYGPCFYKKTNTIHPFFFIGRMTGPNGYEYTIHDDKNFKNYSREL